jgi:hypothetical protein
MKNKYLAYDLIRKGKFVSPEKMVAVEDAMKKNTIVINWWCRQSGKSLTAIKIATDLVTTKTEKTVTIIVNSIGDRTNIMSLLQKSINKDLIKRTTLNFVELTTGSIIKVVTSSNKTANYGLLMASLFKESDIFIVDEYDYIATENMSMILEIIEKAHNLTIMGRIARFFGVIPSNRALFFSSKNNLKNHTELVLRLGEHAAFTYLNYDKIGLDKEKLVKILGKDSFEKEYNSYNENKKPY